MKRKFLNVLFCLILLGIVFLITGCENSEIENNGIIENETIIEEVENEDISEEKVEKINVREKLMKVLNNEEKFTEYSAEDNNIKEYYLKDYDWCDDINKIDKYVYVDLNQDGEDELVALTKAFNGYNLVFHYEDDTIYGYAITIRDLIDIKTDGTFMGTGGATVFGYSNMQFNKGEYYEPTLAFRDNDNYEIDGKKVSKEQFEQFEAQQEAKEDVIWEKFEDNNTEITIEGNYYSEGDSYTDAPFYKFLNDRVEYAGIESYYGTYEIDDDKIIIKYTSYTSPDVQNEPVNEEAVLKIIDEDTLMVEKTSFEDITNFSIRYVKR